MKENIIFKGWTIISGRQVDFKITEYKSDESHYYEWDLNPYPIAEDQMDAHRGEINRNDTLEGLFFRFDSFKKEVEKVKSWRTNSLFNLEGEIKNYFEQIKLSVWNCIQKGKMFSLPIVPAGVNCVTKEIEPDGSTLCGEEYKITFPTGEYIFGETRSKDKCRTFQENPDRSMISFIAYNADGIEIGRYADAWDENN